MTVIATPNNPVSEKFVRVDVARPKSAFTSAEVHKNGDNRFTGQIFPNAGDRIQPHWFEPGRHILVTATNPKDLSWIYETVEGAACDAIEMDIERDRLNLQPSLPERIHTGDMSMGMSMEQAQTKSETDKGMAAKAKLAARMAARKTARMVRWCIAVAISLTIIAAALVATYGYKTMVTGHLTDERPCIIDFSEDFQVSGKRTFSYPFKEIFGVRIIDTKVISEQTVVDIRGDAMTIVGLNGKVLDKATSWSIPVGMGERGIQILKPADVYTFVVNTGKGSPKVRTITHDAMCKG